MKDPKRIIYQLAIHEAWKQDPRTPEPVRPYVKPLEWEAISRHPRFIRLVAEMKDAAAKLWPSGHGPTGSLDKRGWK